MLLIPGCNNQLDRHWIRATSPPQFCNTALATAPVVRLAEKQGLRVSMDVPGLIEYGIFVRVVVGPCAYQTGDQHRFAAAATPGYYNRALVPADHASMDEKPRR